MAQIVRCAQSTPPYLLRKALRTLLILSRGFRTLSSNYHCNEKYLILTVLFFAISTHTWPVIAKASYMYFLSQNSDLRNIHARCTHAMLGTIVFKLASSSARERRASLRVCDIDLY